MYLAGLGEPLKYPDRREASSTTNRSTVVLKKTHTSPRMANCGAEGQLVIDELRNECQKKQRRLDVQGFGQNAFEEYLSASVGANRRDVGLAAGRQDCPQAEKHQIDGAHVLDRKKCLG